MFVVIFDVFICLGWFVGLLAGFTLCFPTGKKASGHFETHDAEETER